MSLLNVWMTPAKPIPDPGLPPHLLEPTGPTAPGTHDPAIHPIGPDLPAAARCALVAITLLVILTGSVLPLGDATDRATDRVGLGEDLPLFAFGHLIAYFTLTLALSYALAPSAFQNEQKPAFLLATAFDVLVELIQGFLPYRTFSLQDIVLNVIGAATAAVLWLAIKKRDGAKRE